MATTVQMIDRPAFDDVIDLGAVRGELDVVEPKYDGRWVTVRIAGGVATAYSRTGRHQFTRQVAAECPDAVLAGEYLFGTTWSKNREDAGCVRVFDCLEMGGCDLRDDSLRVRRDRLAALLGSQGCPDWLKLVGQWPIDQAAGLWRELVEEGNFEGIVFKSSSAPFGDGWARIKKTCTVDYVCMDVIPGSGGYADVAGSLLGGVMVDGKLKAVCRVAGLSAEQRQRFWENRDRLIGRTFEAAGQEVTAAGALRHPRFVRFRFDK